MQVTEYTVKTLYITTANAMFKGPWPWSNSLAQFL